MLTPPTIAPAFSPTARSPGTAPSSVHDEATLPPRDEATTDFGAADRAQPENESPTRIRYFGDYEIIRELARGGMGVVFRARQVSLNRTVALKMILAGQLADDTDVKRFYSEAEAAANLDHPGIVPIYEVGQHEGQHYFSMGFVDGQSLSQRLTEGPLPAPEAAELIRRVSEAVEYAHQHGVIHRDLKPANILLDQNGNPRVTDFGLAKQVQGDSGLTGSGQIMGTPSYMPPEQAGGKRGEVGPAADVYALGATLYALITGRPPFQAATPMDTVIQLISDEPVPPRRLNASIPRDLETICLKCLEKEPVKRYPSAAALADDLGRYLAGEPILARPVDLAERAVKWVRRRPVIAALIASVVVMGLLGMSGVIWQWREAIAARTDAQDQAEIARGEAEFANRRLYDVKMNVAQRAWEDWNPTLFLGSLDEQLPENQHGVNRRGFEWYYWRRKLASGHQTLKGDSALLGVAFSPDGSRIASASSDFAINVWDVATGQKTLTLEGHTGTVSGVAFSPDGLRVASASSDGTVKLWDAATGQEALTLKGHTKEAYGVAFSPDGSRLASVSWDGTVRVWDAATGRETLTLKGRAFPATTVAFSPDGSQIASSSVDVYLWDLATGRETLTLKGHTGLVSSVAFSRDGSRIASSSSDQTVKLWDMTTGHEMHTLKGHTGTVAGVAFSPDGSRVASAGWDQTVKLWDTATGRETRTLTGHTGLVSSVAFSPDGSRLASSSWDSTAKLWDVTTGREPLTLRGHAAGVSSLAFNPDGSRLATAGEDRTVRVWDTVTGQETLVFKRHTGMFMGLAFSPDGSRLACTGGILGKSGDVTVWDARPLDDEPAKPGPVSR